MIPLSPSRPNVCANAICGRYNGGTPATSISLLLGSIGQKVESAGCSTLPAILSSNVQGVSVARANLRRACPRFGFA